MHAALLSYVGKRGVPCRRVGGRPVGPCRDLPSWRIFYLNSSSFEGRSAAYGRDVSRWAQGSCRRQSVRDTVAGKVASRSRMLHSVGAIATVPDMGLYARGRPPCH
jgi:hypothetical protein